MNRMSDQPQFTLFCRVQDQPRQQPDSRRVIESQGSRWYFRIQTDDGQVWLEASDIEVGISRERLELLAVVRGLEAFDQPSQITLVTANPQISRSVRQGLDYWRDRNWMWERFGEKVPMTNRDLWQRVDRATKIHTIGCRTYRLDAGHTAALPVRVAASAPAIESPSKRFAARTRTTPPARPMAAATRMAANSLRRLADSLVRLAPDSTNPHPAA